MQTHKIDWLRLPQIIAKNIRGQFKAQYDTNRDVDIVRTCVFTSMREDTHVESDRQRMVNDFYACNYDVNLLVTAGHQEKCVDISLAVEMLFMATVPDAYDIAGKRKIIMYQPVYPIVIT